MSEINENTAGADSTTKIEQTSSSGMVSFDDLEAITDNKSSRHSDQVAPPKSKKGGEVDENDGDDAKKINADEKKSAKDAKSDKENDDKNADEKATDESKDAVQAGKPKLYKYKSGDKDLEIADDSKFAVPVAGKNEEVSFKELVSNYSGKVNFGRIATDLDKREKTIQSERKDIDDVNGYVNEIYTLAHTQDKPWEAIQYLSELMGGDGVKLVKDMQAKTFAWAEKMMKLTPEQRDAESAKWESDILKAKIARRDATDVKKRDSETFATRVDGVKTKHKIDDARFTQVYNHYKKMVVDGKLKSEALSPEFIGEMSDRWNREDTILDVVKGLNLEDQAANAAALELFNEWEKDTSLTKAQIQNIASSVFGAKKPASNKLKEKMERNGHVNADTSRAAKKPVSEAISFDDLD